MKNVSQWKQLIVLAVSTAISVGCGKKNSDSAGAPTPPAVDKDKRLPLDNTSTKAAKLSQIKIRGKESLGKLKDSNLTLNFEIDGENINVRDVDFRCKRTGEREFTPCNQQGTNSYNFLNLVNGTNYELAVQAVNRIDPTQIVHDSVQFIANVEALALPVLNLSPMNGITVGQFYRVFIPENMRIISHSSSKTTDGGLVHYRLKSYFPPFSSLPCIDGYLDQLMAAFPGAPQQVYCVGRPNRDFYKLMTEGRYANNHLELSDGVSHETETRVLAVHVYDEEPEVINAISRFDNLCGVGVLDRISVGPVILGRTLFGEEIRTTLYVCNALVQGEYWHVATAELSKNAPVKRAAITYMERGNPAPLSAWAGDARAIIAFTLTERTPH